MFVDKNGKMLKLPRQTMWSHREKCVKNIDWSRLCEGYLRKVRRSCGELAGDIDFARLGYT